MIARVTFLSNVKSLRIVGMSHYCDRLVAGGLITNHFQTELDSFKIEESNYSEEIDISRFHFLYV